jgi:transposase
VRTWAPRGHTPVLQYHFNWKVLSATAGISWWNFYFRLYPGTIRAPQVINFLGHLLRHLPGKLLVVWDGLPAHRARLVAEFIRAQQGRLAIERLPAYAPELNPVEYIWGYWKHHELPNFCPRDFAQLSVRRAVRCAACAAAHPWCDPSGAKQICHYDMQASIVCEPRGSVIVADDHRALGFVCRGWTGDLVELLRVLPEDLATH